MENKKLNLICLHGFMGAPSDWAFLEKKIQVNVVCPSIPLVTFENALNSLHDEIDQLEGEKVLMGYSMGGRLAMGLLQKYPESYSKGIIISANPGLKSEDEKAKRKAWDKQQISEIKNADLTTFLEKWFSLGLYGDLSKKPLFRKIIEKRSTQNKDQFIKQIDLLSVAHQPDYWELPNIFKNRLFFLAGSVDDKYAHFAKTWDSQYPNVEAKIFEGCGHMLHLENSEAFIQAIKNFLY